MIKKRGWLSNLLERRENKKAVIKLKKKTSKRRKEIKCTEFSTRSRTGGEHLPLVSGENSGTPKEPTRAKRASRQSMTGGGRFLLEKEEKKARQKVVLKRKRGTEKKIREKRKKGIIKERVIRKEALKEKKEEIKWFPQMSVGEQALDKQHQTLLAKINELVKKASWGGNIQTIRGIIDFLGKYAKVHFKDEENYMAKWGYPGLEQHRKLHQGFADFFEKFKGEFKLIYLSKAVSSEELKKLAGKAREFLGQWLINHILIDDHKYAEHTRLKREKTSEEKAQRGVGEKRGEKEKLKEEKKAGGEEAFNLAKVKEEIERRLKKGGEKGEEVLRQREPITKHLEKVKEPKKLGLEKGKWVLTGVPGFDELMEKGIPKGTAILVAGGPGSGKTIFCLQTLNYAACQGEKCLYMTFEESPERLKEHMKDFGWEAEALIKKGNLIIKKYSPFEITRQVEAMLEEAKGELLIDIEPIVFPPGFKPDRIAVDSLSAIASAFVGKEETYRIYIEQLFKLLEKSGATAFLISESTDVATRLTVSGVEEFLADGVFVFYNIKRGNVRELATEILKIRGASFQKKIVAMEIKSGEGIIVYPEQEVFGEIGGS